MGDRDPEINWKRRLETGVQKSRERGQGDPDRWTETRREECPVRRKSGAPMG